MNNYETTADVTENKHYSNMMMKNGLYNDVEMASKGDKSEQI